MKVPPEQRETVVRVIGEYVLRVIETVAREGGGSSRAARRRRRRKRIVIPGTNTHPKETNS